MPNSWHCENLYAGDPSVFTGQDCTVTASSTIAATLPATTTPQIVRDDGTLVFGLGIVIFFLAIMFFGLLFNSFGLKK